MRILIYSIFILMASFCYGQEYEEINGFKLGFPISEIVDFDDYSLTTDTEADTQKFYKDVLINGIETTVFVRTLNGNVEELIFSKYVKKSDIKHIISDMSEQLGFTEKDLKRDTSGDFDLVFFPEKNDILYNISLMMHDIKQISETNVSEGYQTKKMHDHLNSYFENQNSLGVKK